MPEGDTIFRLAARITERFVGHEVLRTTVRDPRLVGFDASSSTLVGVRAAGKYLLMRFDDGRTLISHLRLDGGWYVGTRPRAATWRQRLELEFDNGPLIAVDLPEFALVDTTDEHSVIGVLGPDVCATDEPDLHELATRLASEGPRPLAEAMLDQRVIAGFGNVFAVEVPYIAGTAPHSPAGSIDAIGLLVEVGVRLIRWSAAGHARNTTGRRLHQADHHIYRSASGRCPDCGARLRTQAAAESPWGRATWWCPVCQPAGQVDRERIARLLRTHPAGPHDGWAQGGPWR